MSESKIQRETQRMAAEIADDCIGVRVRMLNRIVTRIYDDALREYGIKFSQMNILTLIVLKGPIQPTEIGRLLSIEKSTLSRNVRLMEENGWVQSKAAESGNAQRLELTGRGRRLYRDASRGWKLAQEQLTELMGGSALTGIRDAVRDISDEAT